MVPPPIHIHVATWFKLSNKILYLSDTTAETGSTFSVVAASVATVVAVLLLLVGLAVATTLYRVVKRRENNREVILHKGKGDKNTLPELM